MKATLAQLLHVRPWEYEQLTIREFRHFVAVAEAYNREARRASQTAR